MAACPSGSTRVVVTSESVEIGYSTSRARVGRHRLGEQKGDLPTVIDSGHRGSNEGGRERKVPLTENLERDLKAIRHLRGPLVFCQEDGSPMSVWQFHERLEATCRRAGLRRIRWHDLRHSFASQLVSSGVPLRQVQDWLGHSTITMVMRYAHLCPGADSELIGVLDRKQSYGDLTATDSTTTCNQAK